MNKNIVKCIVLLAVIITLQQCKKPTEESAVIISGEYTMPENFPSWIHDAVFYQVYPQTFYDTDGDGIGDLEGIIQKLDYIKSLGVDAVWINPFFESPFCDAGYDVSDYYKVAPRYGTNEDARRLFEEAHKRDLKIIFDYVISYTSVEHPWFKASARQDTNKYTNWYIWNDNTWMNPPEAYKDAFVKGYSRRNGQYMRNFYWCQPALNFGFAKPEQPWMLPTDHPDVLALREELKNVLRFWMDMGADGFRADMAGALVKNANITGNDQFFNVRDQGTKEFWRGIRQLLMTEYPEAFMIAEWSYPKDALDGLFHADFFHWFEGYNDLFQKESWRILNGYSEGNSFFDREGKGTITHFLKSYLDQYEATKGKGYISLPLGNHDNARLGNRRSDDDLEIIYAFGLTMPGIPFIYYGNEIGMRQLGADWPQVEGAYKPRNGGRTPMQWASGKNLGFSAATQEKLYLPVDPAENAPTVAEQENDPHSLLNRTRNLIALRHKEPALEACAQFIPLYAKDNTYPFVYARAKDKDVILVFLNPAAAEADAEFRAEIPWTELQLLAGKELKISKSDKTVKVNMPGVSYAVYKVQ
ncbi:MAG: alpha-amylase [Bacteroidales bacterium]|nr:alpha-amylase [Bacteroidales bacterium]MBN2763443.1 alpha-amylase [Bacteroidales bacterium]